MRNETNRRAAGILAACMLLLCLAGCAPSAERLIKKGVPDTDRWTARLAVEVKGTMQSADGGIEVGTTIDAEIAKDGPLSHASGTTGILMYGESYTVPMDSWAVEDGKEITAYTLSNGSYVVSKADLSASVGMADVIGLDPDLFEDTIVEAAEGGGYILMGKVAIEALDAIGVNALLSSISPDGAASLLDAVLTYDADKHLTGMAFDMTSDAFEVCHIEVSDLRYGDAELQLPEELLNMH